MSQQTVSTREVPRHDLPGGMVATIEIEAEQGVRLVAQLMQLSAGGVGFMLPERLEGIHAAAMLPDAVIRLGKLEIRGNVQVLYTNEAAEDTYYCGARFFPASEADANELIGLACRLGDLPKS